MTVNKVANCDKYPVPKTEALLTTLNGGQKFIKLDLSQAYQQLLLSYYKYAQRHISTN